MKLAIIGANGKSGKLLVDEAIKRGHQVTAVIRKGQPDNPDAQVLIKDLFELTYDDLKDYDVIIDAFGTWEPTSFPLHQTSLKHLADLLSNKPNRLLVVGSAGGLFLDNSHRLRLLDSADMPEIYKPLSTAMTQAFDDLKIRHDVKWTYFSPAAVFDADGLASGNFHLGNDELLTNGKGESYLSYADGATILIDEVEHADYLNKRFTAAALA